MATRYRRGTLILTAEAEAAGRGCTQGKGDGRRHGDRRRRAGCRLRRGVRRLRSGRGAGARHRRLKDVPIIEIAVKGGDKVKPEDPADHARKSDKASMEVPSPAAGTREGPEGRHRRQGQRRQPDLDFGDRGRGRCSLPRLRPRGPAATPAAPTPAGGATRATPMSNATCWCSAPAGRLLGGVPLRRSRHDHGAGGALPDARRRLPQCRLHSVQGAAAHRRRHGGSQGDGRARHRLLETADRRHQAARAQGEGDRQAHRRSGRHGEGA